jgi:hypothetical protein
METFINICGFFGSWLIVAGSLYQAALELKDQDIARDHIEETRQNIPPQRHASAWWWLLPPVKIVLERRLSNSWRRDFLQALPREDIAGLLSFMNKATGWIFVSSGGLLLAVKESYELIHGLEANLVWFWVLCIVMPLLCALNTAVRARRTQQVLEHYKV